MHRSLLRDSPQCYSPNLVEGGFSEVELPLYGVLRSSHDPHLHSLRVFSESFSIVCLFGARRLSQQSHSFSPEPQKGAYPYVRSHRTSGLFWHIAPSPDNKAALIIRVLG